MSALVWPKKTWLFHVVYGFSLSPSLSMADELRTFDILKVQ